MERVLKMLIVVVL
jgi:hypothetical protein